MSSEAVALIRRTIADLESQKKQLPPLGVPTFPSPLMQVLMGKPETPEEVAKLVCFLLSEDAAYINGESIMIDGGSTLHSFPKWFSLDYSKENHQEWT
jgi:3-oxoacyl-[acyl-carrier protein] reductase